MKLDEKKMLQTLSSGYVFAMLLFFPLIYHNNYIDIVQTKKYFFLGMTFVYAVLCLVLTMVAELRGRRAEVIEKHPWNRVDAWAVVLCAGLALSTIFAGDEKDALWGFTGRNFGAVVLLSGLLGYFLVSRFFVMSQSVLWAYLLGSGCVFLLAVLNAFQIDLLRMKENLDPAQHYFFVGTMGNMDVTACFGAIMVTVGMMLFYCAKEKFSQKIYGAHVFLGFCAMICCRCDTAVVCVCAAFLVTGWFAFSDGGNLRAARRLFFLWIASSAVIGAFRLVLAGHSYEFDGLCALAVSWQAVAAEAILWAALFAYEKRAGEQGAVTSKKARRIFGGILLAAAAAGVLAFVAANVSGVSHGMLARFTITDEFGNYRGYIWKRSMQAYIDAPAFRKVFGYGMNQFPEFIRAYETEMTERFQSAFIDAHSEYLQMLATTGLFGAVGFFGMMAAGFWQCVRNLKQANAQKLAPLAGIAVLLVYFAQAFANNPQVFTTPLYLIFMGIVARSGDL